MDSWLGRRAAHFIATCVIGGSLGLAAGTLLGFPKIPCAELGVILALAFLWLSDLANAKAIMRWLKNEEARAEIPLEHSRSILWQELARRAARILRARDQEIQREKGQLDRILSALEAAPVGFILLDQHNRVIWGNASAGRYLDLFFPRDFDQHITNLVRQPDFVESFESLASGKGKPLKIRWGRERRNSLAVFMTAYSENQRKLLMLEDITENERADQTRRDFVANVSHEIRTPLTVLAGFVETLRTLPLPDEERANYLALMAEQTSRMSRLIDDLLILAKLEGTPGPGTDVWIKLGGLTSQAEQAARPLFDGRRPLEFDLPDQEDTRIAGEEAELFSALFNLLSNAARYTPPDSIVTLIWRRESDGSGRLGVRDNGAGIAREHLTRLTERFYRVDPSRSRQTGGTGLGLAIVKHIVERHGGRLIVESELGKGSAFTLHFPAMRIRQGTPSGEK